MAVKGGVTLTYADWAARHDASGKTSTILEILNQSNEILDDMLVKEANDGTGNKTTVRTGLPQAAWRMLNYGVPKAKSTTAQVRDTSGMLEVYAEVDKSLADLEGDTAAFRLSEASAFMEGMNQQMASTVFYGNTRVNPERFLGLAPRYSTMILANAASAANVLNFGGVGSDNTSIWLVCWGDTTVYGFFPKGSKAGLQHQDLGEQTLKDAAGGQYQGYRDHFKWDLGLAVRDWRYVVRICNIDVSDITDPAVSAANLAKLINFMILAEEKIPNLGTGKPVWYMRRELRAALRLAILNKIAYNLTEENVAGKRTTMFDGFPVRIVDALLVNEATVV
jgi:hypothetical protein